MISHRNQRGIALVMALVMLVVLSMIAVSSTRSANSSIRIVGNMQIQDEIETAAQAGIESVLSDIANFTAPADRTVSVTVGATTYDVAVHAPVCENSVEISGNSIKTTPPKMNYYNVQADVTDARTGTSVTIHQGIRIALPPYQSC